MSTSTTPSSELVGRNEDTRNPQETSSSLNETSCPKSPDTAAPVEPVMIGRYTEQELVQRARSLVHERTKGWESAEQRARGGRIPRLYWDEMEVGRVLGEGGFFRVSEITNITLRKTPSLENDATKEGTFTEAPKEESAILKHADSRRQARGSAKPRPRISRSKPRRQPSRPTSHEDVEEEYIQSVVQDREFMQAHCLRAGYDGRYALKTMLKSSRDDPNLFVDTLVDLAMEVHFLNTIRHPNILKMRAISHEPAASMNDTDNTDYRDLDWMQPNAFLILDRIYDTLSARLVKWKATSQNTFAKLFDFYQRREKDFLARRLVVAFDIASAIDHLHEQNIMYRDLKPSNVGFDVRDDPKLFDFGLATELPPERAMNGSYKMTGDTGTMRYMAPEVALSQVYDTSADVFSFGILLWEMLALEVPYGKLNDDAIYRKVIDLGYRPPIQDEWHDSLQILLRDCFGTRLQRPTMEGITKTLKKTVLEVAPSADWFEAETLVNSARSAMTADSI